MNKPRVNFHKIMKNKSISIKAKGLYSYLFSFIGDPKGMPPVDIIATDLGIQKSTLYKYINELIDNGLLIKTQIRDEGKFAGMSYELKEIQGEINEKKNLYS